MSIVKGIKVGTTNITSTYNNESDSKELTVAPVALGSISKPDATTYTGSAIEVKPVITVNFDGVDVVLVEGEDYTLSYYNNTNVGNATVTATGIGNYTGTLSETWQIRGADVSVIANDQSYDYDGDLHGVAIEVSTVGEINAAVRYSFEPGLYDMVDPPQISDVVDSGIVYFKVFAQNHNDYEGSYRLDIGPRVAVLEWGPLVWIYDGNEHQTTCTVLNLIPGDTCTVTLYGNSITAVGTQTVVARAADSLSNPNYMLVEDESRTLIVSPGLFVKLSGNWIPIKKVFKMVSGSWVQQEPSSTFSTTEKYIRLN